MVLILAGYQTRLDKKTAEEEVASKMKAAAGAQGKLTGMSGRDLFQFNPDWFEDDNEEDDEEEDMAQYRREEEEDEEDGGPEYLSDMVRELNVNNPTPTPPPAAADIAEEGSLPEVPGGGGELAGAKGKIKLKNAVEI